MSLRDKLFILVAVAVIGAGMAVNPAQAGTIVGGRIGFSIADADTDLSGLVDQDNRNGFAGTGFIQFGDGLLSLQPEVSYIEKGVENVELTYLELAALLKVGIPLIPLVTPHVFGGVGADFEIDSNLPANVSTKELDWNAIFGIDAMFNLTRLYVVGDARYAVGLTDINDIPAAVGDFKNRAWILSAGVGFRF